MGALGQQEGRWFPWPQERGGDLVDSVLHLLCLSAPSLCPHALSVCVLALNSLLHPSFLPLCSLLPHSPISVPLCSLCASLSFFAIPLLSLLPPCPHSQLAPVSLCF